MRHERRALAAQLSERGLSVVVLVPARNEEDTVAGVVRPLVRHLVPAGVVDEVVVVDDGSTDRTATRAAAAGARVLRVADVLAGHGGAGKGGAMWRGLAATTADLVVYLDADLLDFDPDTVTRLVQPLLVDAAAGLVKGSWQRPLGSDPAGGGRVTELAARPLLARFFPELSFVRQPLAGEYAGRRTLLERLPFLSGWGVDIGLLLDAARLAGPASVHQVDLGIRRHRNRPLVELGVPAATVLLAVLARAGLGGTGMPGLTLDGTHVSLTELPPLATLGALRNCQDPRTAAVT